MDTPPTQENLLRWYLLGATTPDEEAEIEQRLKQEEDARDELRLVEEDLIDDYARGALPSDERELFEQHFLSTPDRREKLDFAAAALNYVAKQEPLSDGSVSAHLTRKINARRGQEPDESNVAEDFTAKLLSLAKKIYFPYWKITVTASVLVLIVLFAWRPWWQRYELKRGIEALNLAYSRERPFGARVTQLNYAPFVVKKGDGQDDRNEVERDRAARILLDAMHDFKSPASHHALGVYYLTEKKIELAISEFEIALKGAPNDARLHSDMGAALLELSRAESVGASGRSLRTFDNCLGHLNKAIELDNTLLEPLFNRALLRQSAGLSSLAKEDWELYLQKDPASPWSVEARHYLEEIEKQIKKNALKLTDLYREYLQAVSRNDRASAWLVFNQGYSRTGNSIYDQILDEFLASVQNSGINDDSLQRQRLNDLKSLIRANSEDAFFRDAINRYLSASPRSLLKLSSARQLARQAYRSFADASDFKSAIGAYEKSIFLFEQEGDVPESLATKLWRSYCLLQQSYDQQEAAKFFRVLESSQVLKYKHLQSIAYIALSNIKSMRREYSDVREFCSLAADLSREIGDWSGQMRSLNNLAGAYREIGNPRKSWQAAIQGIEIGQKIYADASQLIGYYAISARNFSEMGLYAAAMEYSQVAIRLGYEMGSPPFVMSRYLPLLAELYYKLGKEPEAAEAMQAAMTYADSRKHESAGDEMRSYILLQLARAERRKGRPANALELISTVAPPGKVPYSWFSYAAAKERAFSMVATGDRVAARKELHSLLSQEATSREAIREVDFRNSYFNNSQTIYDLAIDIESALSDDPARGFEYSEASRAKSLLDSVHGGAIVTPQPARFDKQGSVQNDLKDIGENNIQIFLNRTARSLSLKEIQQRMPAQWQILQFAVLEDKILSWLISRERVEFSAVFVSQERLNGLIKDYLEELSSSSMGEGVNHLFIGKELFALLIEPIKEKLDPNLSICLVLDKSLHAIPFGTLPVKSSGRYLLEEYAITYSASASMFILTSELAHEKENISEERLLSVAVSDFRKRAKDLPCAESESLEIGEHYSVRKSFVNAQAVKDSVLSAMTEASVIHFTTHYVADKTDALKSSLLLFSENSDDGPANRLAAYEIYRTPLPKTRLAILSACTTQTEEILNGEGAIGLSRSFRVAGVPIVVSTLWEIDSCASSVLMKEFHQIRRRGGRSTAEALRQAQINLLHLQQSMYRHPYYWGAFIASGGASKF